MGDRGIPKTWRHMNGYSSHTYSWLNAAGELFWVKYHFKTDQGIDFLTQEDADRLAGEDGDYHQRDLFTSIEDGQLPQLDAERADHAVRGRQDLPVQPVRPDQGVAARRLPADRRRHDDAEPQRRRLPRRRSSRRRSSRTTSCRAPACRPDKMLLARGFSYSDAHRARLGVNYKQIPVNEPKVEVNALLQGRRDADPLRHRPGVRAELDGRPGGRPERAAEVHWASDGDMVRTAYALRPDDDDWGQAGTMVREVLDDDARERLAHNIIGHDRL